MIKGNERKSNIHSEYHPRSEYLGTNVKTQVITKRVKSWFSGKLHIVTVITSTPKQTIIHQLVLLKTVETYTYVHFFFFSDPPRYSDTSNT